jgi:hypothetical protein
LTPPKAVAKAEDIVVGRDAASSRGGRSAVFLPQVAPNRVGTGRNAETSLPQGRSAGNGWKTGRNSPHFRLLSLGIGFQIKDPLAPSLISDDRMEGMQQHSLAAGHRDMAKVKKNYFKERYLLLDIQVSVS